MILRAGHGRRRGRYRPPLMTRFASARQTLTATIPIASTRCFITASMIDSTATAASAAIKACTGCSTRRIRAA